MKSQNSAGTLVCARSEQKYAPTKPKTTRNHETGHVPTVYRLQEGYSSPHLYRHSLEIVHTEIGCCGAVSAAMGNRDVPSDCGYIFLQHHRPNMKLWNPPDSQAIDTGLSAAITILCDVVGDKS